LGEPQVVEFEMEIQHSLQEGILLIKENVPRMTRLPLPWGDNVGSEEVFYEGVTAVPIRHKVFPVVFDGVIKSTMFLD
jgi:hypothetical protein